MYRFICFQIVRSMLKLMNNVNIYCMIFLQVNVSFTYIFYVTNMVNGRFDKINKKK